MQSPVGFSARAFCLFFHRSKMAKKIYTSLDLNLKNTIGGLRAPSNVSDAVRLVDLTDAQLSLSQAISLGDTTEAQTREAAVAQLTNNLAAQVATLESSFQAADTNLSNQLEFQIQSVVSGFTAKDPVYAIANAAISLSGLTINSPSFTGTVPANSRILTIAQGGDIDTAHPDNRIWVAKSGAWVAASDFDESTEIVRSVLVSVENGADNFANTIYFLIEPAIFENAIIGITNLRWARWQGNDRVIADGTTIERNGITFKARLDSDQLITNQNGIALNPAFVNELQNLTNATGLLSVEQISGLLAFILANRLNEFAAPNAAVDFNGQSLKNVANPSLATDAVNLQTYQAGIDNLQTQVDSRDLYVDLTSGTVVDGDTVFTITHGFNSFKIMEKVIDKNTGETVGTDFASVMSNLNTCKVTFRNETSVSASQYGLMLHKVAD
jgi:hypothetical protein